MFETLEDSFEKSKPPLDRGYPILMYSIYAVVSSIVLILTKRRHGFSQLFSLVDWAVVFLLSVTWLVTTLRSSVPVCRRDCVVRGNILLLLLMAQDAVPYIWR